eukprot:scaffold83561_cov21-Tisochrysis_lutea.AAC.1
MSQPCSELAPDSTTCTCAGLKGGRCESEQDVALLEKGESSICEEGLSSSELYPGWLCRKLRAKVCSGWNWCTTVPPP